jgi:hypothetical protein
MVKMLIHVFVTIKDTKLKNILFIENQKAILNNHTSMQWIIVFVIFSANEN